MSQQEPTIANILRQLAAEHDEPVEERRVLEQVLEHRPSSAKNPYATIRERLRWDGLTLGWLRLSRHELVPLRVALRDLRFRCIPRACDVEDGMLPLAHLQPFAGLRGAAVTLRDSDGTTMRLIEPDDEQSGLSMPSFEIRRWLRRHQFAPGDSILVAIESAEPMVMMISHEPAAVFPAPAVAEQDRELLDAIITRVSRSQSALLPCDEVVLPIFAAAAWRTAYPGTPWQQLITQDGRLQLVDDMFLTNRRNAGLRLFSSDEVFEPQPNSGPDRQDADAALLAEIDLLQRELQQSRDQDAAGGIWDGRLQRASAAFGPGSGENTGGFGNLFDSFNDDWFDEDGYPTIDDDDDPEIAALRDAEARMLAALPNDAVERLQYARPEEAEVIIAAHLNMLLVREPSLFPKMELDLSDTINNDHQSAPFETTSWEMSWDDDDDDDWITDLDDDDEEGPVNYTDGAYARSQELINGFRDYLSELGKSSTTARARARALHVYAEFLSSYYGRTLAEGDYATLDECLFFYYPRRVLNTSPRQVREICTAIKQFYRYLRERSVISDDRFADALWRRRNQAARVVEVYERIAGDSPSFELLFEHLFRPYTD
ncbi:MAG: hypothetical protein HC822_17365 [Oscillochloris sp.]|nr:hypothetical protein [Oscillochloris sp.]